MDIIMAQEEVEADHFCWDESEDDKVELMKGIEKGESKQKKDRSRKSSREQHDINKTESDNGHRPL
eukprot:9483852-Ditylum_brightwellii.AAC.1